MERQREMALELIESVRDFDPDAIYYIETGGQNPALVLGEALGLEPRGIDLRYPLSRVLERGGRALGLALFPFKEIAYRLTSPAAGAPPVEPQPGARIALVDDSASSGRTLRAAIRELAAAGVSRDRIIVAVLRCGARARSIVDVSVTGERLIFQRDLRMNRLAT